MEAAGEASNTGWYRARPTATRGVDLRRGREQWGLTDAPEAALLREIDMRRGPASGPCLAPRASDAATKSPSCRP